MSPDAFPADRVGRDRFVLDRRPARVARDPWRHQGLLIEQEPAPSAPGAADLGTSPPSNALPTDLVWTATLFLTGRECPWHCVMCDLWRNALETDTPVGSIPTQVRDAIVDLARDPRPVAVLKLYNAGSFFDPRAVPEEDYDAVAKAVVEAGGVRRLVVESHPTLIGRRVDLLLAVLARHTRPDRPAPALEVAMGLETAHPIALDQLHKRMTVDQFIEACRALRQRQVTVRAFVLLAPPFVPPEEQAHWLLRSVTCAFEAGAAIVSLIPTRSGNGAMEAVAAAGELRSPTLTDIERSVARARARCPSHGRLLLDLWDLERFSECPACFGPRKDRLHAMNLTQQILPPVEIPMCGHRSADA